MANNKPWFLPMSTGSSAIAASTSGETAPFRNGTQRVFVITGFLTSITGASKSFKMALRTQSDERYFNDKVPVSTLIGTDYDSGQIATAKTPQFSFSDNNMPELILNIGDGMILEYENSDASNTGTLNIILVGYLVEGPAG